MEKLVRKAPSGLKYATDILYVGKAYLNGNIH
jgi:hypothetical protein